jgi:NADH:ubiquinone oxidoreductase subunit E
VFERTAPRIEIEEERLAVVSSALDQHREDPGALLPVMIDVNTQLGWLPPDVLRYLAQEMDIPLAQILQVASFYNLFSLVPRGRHIIAVCMGTGCFVKGGQSLLKALERRLSVVVGQTTGDMRFSLEVVRCLGCCALAPVVRVDDDIHAFVDTDQLPGILETYE